MLPLTLFENFTVFTALIKSKLSNKPLTVLYSSLLLVLCLEDFSTATISPDYVTFYILYSNFFHCILHSFFCTDNPLSELARTTNHQREETMEQLWKDHPHRNMCSSWNVLEGSGTSSGHFDGDSNRMLIGYLIGIAISDQKWYSWKITMKNGHILPAWCQWHMVLSAVYMECPIQSHTHSCISNKMECRTEWIQKSSQCNKTIDINTYGNY